MHEATCSKCFRRTVLASVPGHASLLWRTPVLAFSESLVEAWPAGVVPDRACGMPGVPGPILALQADGSFVAVILAQRDDGTSRPPPADAPLQAPLKVRVPHAFACPWERGRIPRPRGERATCHSGRCRREIYWVVLPSGKKAPLDPTPHTGVVLGEIEARAAVHTPGYVIGIDVLGEQRRIREGGQGALPGVEPEMATVWTNHFATCPDRARFARPR